MLVMGRPTASGPADALQCDGLVPAVAQLLVTPKGAIMSFDRLVVLTRLDRAEPKLLLR